MTLRSQLLMLSACAAIAAMTPAAALEVDDHPVLRTLVDELADQHGFGRGALAQIFTRVSFRQEIVDAIERPKEALPWHEYRLLFVTEQNAKRGERFWRENARALDRAATEYGVAPEVIVGILGVETSYGRNQGEHRAIEAMTTLALGYPRRAEFFARELKEFLLLTRELRIDPLLPKGSYAGALGIPQFIPSSYRMYAVDFDGDGRRDLRASAPDAIGSVAHFLQRHGWVSNEPVVDEVRIEGTLHGWIEKLGVKPILSVRSLVSYGVYPRERADVVDGEAVLPDPELTAALVELEGERGPFYRLAYNNFYVITRYNRSKRYAMAVHELAQWVRRLRVGRT